MRQTLSMPVARLDVDGAFQANSAFRTDVGMPPLFSLIVPTRQRPESLARFLRSIESTAEHPEAIEVVLVIDADDAATLRVGAGRLQIKRVRVSPGQTMGTLNMAGYDASTGRYLMLLNDDVLARTYAWDTLLHNCFRAYPDEIVLVHVNDTVFQKELCTFPVVSRRFCELAGGICPREYVRYRIDDHIEDVFILLGLLGESRILYLPNVVFEHLNFVTHASGVRQYFSDPTILARDGPQFDRLFPQRKELALRLKGHIDRLAGRKQQARWQARLDAITDPGPLRRPERLRVIDTDRLTDPQAIARDPSWLSRLGQSIVGDAKKVGPCLKRSGLAGLARAMGRRVWRLIRG
jgi:glycosyltransferase involved in cell wall biosynthesis